MSFDGSLTQDDAGRLELDGNAFKITGEIADIDDLKKVLASRFLRFFSLESVMTVNQQSFLVSNMCGEFMTCGHCESGQKNPKQSCLW